MYPKTKHDFNDSGILIHGLYIINGKDFKTISEQDGILIDHLDGQVCFSY